MLDRFPRAAPFIVGSATAIIVGKLVGLLDWTVPPPPALAPVEAPRPVAVPIVIQKESPPTTPVDPKPAKKQKQPKRVTPPAPLPEPELIERPSPIRAKLAEAAARPDAGFELADQLESLASSVGRAEGASIRACLTQFRLTAKRATLEHCVDLYERASVD